ncbi:Asp-tRNA(Asn)/Glu-tRNA(Gln) amidotransferase subunit GatC [Candidatus Wolfebacteria bacterium]|nr:Asp-tRNA(Asn)/Glu-tRNA(Gln) amidotransferase subunit GatC [Candidatus Wolfebacteria bacterium]
MTKINKEALKHLEELARIEIGEKKQEKTLKDLQEILNYFEELKEVNTKGIEPMAGGTIETNIFREDSEEGQESRVNGQKLINAFPDEENRFLKVPAVFE